MRWHWNIYRNICGRSWHSCISGLQEPQLSRPRQHLVGLGTSTCMTCSWKMCFVLCAVLCGVLVLGGVVAMSYKLWEHHDKSKAQLWSAAQREILMVLGICDPVPVDKVGHIQLFESQHADTLLPIIKKFVANATSQWCGFIAANGIPHAARQLGPWY